MKRLLNYKLFIILLCLSTLCRAQELTIKLEDRQEFTLKDTLFVNIIFKNLEQEPRIYLKPDIENITFGLMAFILKNENSKKKYVYYIGDGGDIDEIRLTCDNSISLEKHESFAKQIPIVLKEFSPMLDDVGTYSLSLLIDYSIVDFKIDYCQHNKIFKGKLRYVLKDLRLR
jgi:hypothetical protein